MKRLIARLRATTALGVRNLSDEERDAHAVQREQRERDRKQGESYIRTYAEPAANWGRERRDDSDSR